MHVFPFVTTVVSVALIFASSTVSLAAEIEPNFLMIREPEEKVLPEIWVLSPELLPLWRMALKRPESELQRQAAEAIARAHQLGHEGMAATSLDLRAVVVSPKSHPAARFAAAHALIVLDQRDSAATLFEISRQQGKDLRQLVEPALARWNFEPIRDEWHHRIASISTPRRDLMLAINGVAQEHDSAATDDLLALALPVEQPGDIRLAAARAIGRIATTGQEHSAERLLARQPNLVIDRLCAISLILGHTSELAIRLQQQLGADKEPAVAAAALQALFANNALVLPLAEQALLNLDANVRRIAIQTHVDQPTVERIRSLATFLNDPHPELRSLVRESFYSLSRDPMLNGPIRESSIAVLEGNDWRGQEQAALLLGALDQESVAGRLMELVESPRPEVMVAAAWALKTVEAPGTASAVLELARRRSEGQNGNLLYVDAQMAHLFELLGRFKTVEAAPVLEKYVPKSTVYGEMSRSAAIWALGLIYEGQSNEALAKQLMERIRDTMSIPPEVPEVRRTSGLTIGRLQGNSQLSGLKAMIGDAVRNDRVDLALRWAVLRISGEALPLAPQPISERTGWFLEPLSRRK